MAFENRREDEKVVERIQIADYTDLEALKADQAQQSERMEAMEKVQLEILAKLTVLAGSIADNPLASSS